jgi:hypothetical protein
MVQALAAIPAWGHRGQHRPRLSVRGATGGHPAAVARPARTPEYGLPGSAWPQDVARRVRTGTFSTDMLGPFGGYENSGTGGSSAPGV